MSKEKGATAPGVREREWRYYIPYEGHDSVEDARPVPTGSTIWDAKSAAEAVMTAHWDNGGYEAGFNAKWEMVVVAPDGTETTCVCVSEPDVIHYANVKRETTRGEA